MMTGIIIPFLCARTMQKGDFMEYQILLSRLKRLNYQPQIFGRMDCNCDMLNIRILTAGQTHFEESILYLTTTALMPDPRTDHAFTLFCCGESIDFSQYQESVFTIAYFGADIPQAELFNTTLENLTEIQQITAGMHILTNALFSGNGLQHLIDTASHLFGNPIYVVDLQNKYLAMSAGIIPDNDFFREESASGYISEKGIRSIRANKLDEKVRRGDTAYYYINELVQKGMLVDAIHIQDVEVGHIMMLESEHPFREFDSDFFHRFGKLVSMELQKNSAYSRNKGVMYSYFLADLLKNPKQNVSDIRERLKILGYNLKETFYIMAIPPVGHSFSDLKLEVILEYLKQIFGGSIYVIYEDTIVFLISRAMDQNLSEYEISQLSAYLSANHLKAGISNFYQNLEDTPRFYQQAIDSVHLGLRLKDPAPIYYYSDYYLYQMLELYEKEDSQIRFLIHPGLMKLYLYDQEKNTDFMVTLREYLTRPGQPAKIAENLHIHKNTLLYRMGKIKEITDCEFVEGEDFMNFNLSVRIMRYLGMIE